MVGGEFIYPDQGIVRAITGSVLLKKGRRRMPDSSATTLSEPGIRPDIAGYQLNLRKPN